MLIFGGSADFADHADFADFVDSADSADFADFADFADSADSTDSTAVPKIFQSPDLPRTAEKIIMFGYDFFSSFLLATFHLNLFNNQVWRITQQK